jgi:hypothetical protein
MIFNFREFHRHTLQYPTLPCYKRHVVGVANYKVEILGGFQWKKAHTKFCVEIVTWLNSLNMTPKDSTAIA